MVKIQRYKPLTKATNRSPNSFSNIRYNPSDFSRASDAIAKFGQTAQNVGLNLLQQDESNKARAAEVKSNQDLKMLETLEKQKNDLAVLDIKNARTTKMHLNMDLAFNGTADNPGLKKLSFDYMNNPDWENNEKNFNQIVQKKKEEMLASIDDDVLRNDFSIKFDNAADGLAINVMSGSHKTKIQQLTSAYESRLEDLKYDMEFGNGFQKDIAKKELLGVYDVNGKPIVNSIHREAFGNGIINITPELAEQYSSGDVEFIQAKIMIANDPEAYLALTEGKKNKYPYKNLTLNQRADLDIQAKNAIRIMNNTAASNLKTLIKDNASELNDMVKMLDDGNMPKNGLVDLNRILTLATSYGDQDTIDKANDYIAMYGTFNTALQLNPNQLQDELNQTRAEINKLNMPETTVTRADDGSTTQTRTDTTIPGISKELVLKEKALTTVLNKMNAELNKDSLSWANQTNLVSLDPVDWLKADDDTFQAWVNKRKGQNDIVRAKYQTVDNFLTKADQQMIMNIWQDPDTDNDTKIFLMKRLATFGEDADKVFSEVLYKGEGKNESKYFAHLAGLMNSKDFDLTTNTLAQSFLNGFNDKNNESLISRNVMFGKVEEYGKQVQARELFTDTIGGSFHQVDGKTLENIFEMAKIIYVDKARGDTSRAINEELFNSIVGELVGQSTKIENGKSVQYGGFTEYNRQNTLVPSWMNAEKFERVIERVTMLYPDKIMNGQIPEWKYGDSSGEFQLQGNAKSIFNRDGDQPYLWVINDGVYAVSFNQPWNNSDPQYVGTSSGGNNGYFILDLNLVKDDILRIQDIL